MTNTKWLEDFFQLPKEEVKTQVKTFWYVCDCGKKFRSESGIDYHKDFQCK